MAGKTLGVAMVSRGERSVSSVAPPNVSRSALPSRLRSLWKTRLRRLGALTAIFAMALTIGVSAPTQVKAADAANFPGLQDAYWVIDNLSEYELQIWDSSCNSGEGCYRIINSTALPANGSTEWIDTDDTGSFRIRKHGNKIELFTLDQTRQEWIDGAQSGAETYTRNAVGKTGYSYDMNPNGFDVIITYKNGAKDVNGNRSDVVVNIEKFAIYEPENAKRDYASYRRSLLDVGTTGFRFRNYLLQPKDCPAGNGEWKHGTDNGGSGNLSDSQGGYQYGTGTWIDAGIKIVDGKADQTFLFSVGDLDISTGQQGSNKIFGPGSEGIDLGYGFDLSTLVVSSNTKLDTYGTEGEDGNEEYVKYFDHSTGLVDPNKGLGNYLVGSSNDGNTDASRFFVLGAANGASFTWTSKWNCDTDFLELNVAKQIWHPMPPVTMQVQAEKEFLGADLTDDLFNFQLAIDNRDDNPFKDNPHEPAGGTGSLDASTGVITFPQLSFQMSDDEAYNPIGTHYYKFYEVKGDDSSIVYDETVHTVRIEIKGVENDIGMRTLGYTLRAYLDDAEDPFFVTHSSMEAPYGIVKIAASGATSGEFLSHTFTDLATGHTYTYDEDKLEWVRDDGVEGDPPADATSTFDMSYAQARTMALAGVEGFDSDLLESTVWTEGDKQYKYYDNVPLELTFEQASTVLTEERQLQGYTWADGDDSYAWGEHTGLIPWGTLTQAEQSSSDVMGKTWTDPETGDTYMRDTIVHQKRWDEYNSSRYWQTWTDPDTGDTYDYRYHNDKLHIGHVYFKNMGQGTDEKAYFFVATTGQGITSPNALRAGLSNEQLGTVSWSCSPGLGTYTYTYDIAAGVWNIKRFVPGEGLFYSTASTLPYDNNYGKCIPEVRERGYWYEIYSLGADWSVRKLASQPSDVVSSSGGPTRISGAAAFNRLKTKDLNAHEFTDPETGNTYVSTLVGTYSHSSDYLQERQVWFVNRGQGTNEEIYINFLNDGSTYSHSYVDLLGEGLTPEQLQITKFVDSEGFSYEYDPRSGKWGWFNPGGEKLGEVEQPENGYTWWPFYGTIANAGDYGWHKIYYDDEMGTWSTTKTTLPPPADATASGGSYPVTIREMIDNDPEFWNEYGPIAIEGYTFHEPGTDNTYMYTYFDDLYTATDDGWRWVRANKTNGEEELLTSIDESLYDTLYDDGWRKAWTENKGEPTERIRSNGKWLDKIFATVTPSDITVNVWVKNLGTPEATIVYSVPNNALGEPEEQGVWVKNKGQADEEIVDGPAVNALSDYSDTKTGWVKNSSELVGEPPAGSTANVTLSKTWLKETRTPDGSTGTFIEVRDAPSGSSTASFPVRYGDASYTVQDGLVKENIRALPWTDPNTGDTYTWDGENNTWLENGTTPVSAPTDTAIAELWSAPEYTTVDTGDAGTFTNRKIYNLTIEKKIAGSWASPSDEFDFTVNVPALAGQSVEVVLATEASGDTPASEQTVTADFDDTGEWSFTLRGGQSVVIPGITGRTAYSVSEGAVATYAASAQVTAGDTTGVTNTVGTSTGSDAEAVSDESLEANTTVTFTNTRNEHSLSVSKTVEGDSGSAGTFGFTVIAPELAGAIVADGDGNPVIFDDSGMYGFTLEDGQSLTIVGLPEGLQYTVEESAESAEGYTTTVDGEEGRATSGVLMADASHEFVNSKFAPPATGLLGSAVFGGWLWLAICGVLGGFVGLRMAERWRLRKASL